MEDRKPSTESKPKESEHSCPDRLPELSLPVINEAPKPHPPRFIDPRIVEAHFAPLLKNLPSPEERWARKANATPFTL